MITINLNTASSGEILNAWNNDKQAEVSPKLFGVYQNAYYTAKANESDKLAKQNFDAYTRNHPLHNASDLGTLNNVRASQGLGPVSLSDVKILQSTTPTNLDRGIILSNPVTVVNPINPDRSTTSTSSKVPIGIVAAVLIGLVMISQAKKPNRRGNSS